LAFAAAERLGFSYSPLAPSIEIPSERFLELYLEIGGPAPEAAQASQEAIAEALQALSQGGGAREPSDQEAAALADPARLPSSAQILEGGAAAPAGPGEDRTMNLEETAPALKSYNSLVRTAVARHWILPPAARSNFQPGRLVAVMTLSRQGQVQVIMVEESSGIPALDFAAMEALRGAAPYPPFPPELGGHQALNFRFHFDYKAVQRRPGAAGGYAPDEE
jgi:TonB family protein